MDQLKLFFNDQNIFSLTQPNITFDLFKKIFFPHLYAVQEEPDDAEEKKAAHFRDQVAQNYQEQHLIMQKRLQTLEQKIK